MLENYYQNKYLKYLILVLSIISLVVLFKEIILKPKPITFSQPSFYLTSPKIDFKILRDPEIEKLLLFERTLPSQSIGRENPFLPVD